jgi:hypothetical protein
LQICFFPPSSSPQINSILTMIANSNALVRFNSIYFSFLTLSDDALFAVASDALMHIWIMWKRELYWVGGGSWKKLQKNFNFHHACKRGCQIKINKKMKTPRELPIRKWFAINSMISKEFISIFFIHPLNRSRKLNKNRCKWQSWSGRWCWQWWWHATYGWYWLHRSWFERYVAA